MKPFALINDYDGCINLEYKPHFSKNAIVFLRIYVVPHNYSSQKSTRLAILGDLSVQLINKMVVEQAGVFLICLIDLKNNFRYNCYYNL